MPTALRRAATQYVAHLAIFGLMYWVLTAHPYFGWQLHEYARLLCGWLVAGYAALGLPYLYVRYHYWVTTAAAYRRERLCLVWRWVSGALATRDVPAARTAALSYVVKFFFFPLMLSFMVGHWLAFIQLWQQLVPGQGVWSFLTQHSYHLWFNLIFLVDTAIFATAYLVESRRLGNTIRSVDPFPSSWVVTLICYPPFNFGLNELLPLTKGGLLVPGWLATMLSLAMLAAFTWYVWASVALGWRAGNLVHRGVVRRGPYGYMRHPAYAAKNVAWWLEFIPVLTPLTFVALVGWNIIYILRGLTEERHLAMVDADYRKYQREVRWRFIPGVW